MAASARTVLKEKGSPTKPRARVKKSLAGWRSNAELSSQLSHQIHTTITYTTMGAKSSDKSSKVDKVSKKDKSDKKSKKDSKPAGEKKDNVAKATAASLLADKKAVNPALSSLFAAQVCISWKSCARLQY
jgi:hypothetical protein